MKAKMFKLSTLGLLAVALLTACRFNPLDTIGATRVTGSGKVVNETRNVSGFDGLIIVGAGKINIDRTGTESLSITTDDNLLQYIDTQVRGGKLVIAHVIQARIGLGQPLAHGAHQCPAADIHTGGLTPDLRKTTDAQEIAGLAADVDEAH